MTERLEPFALSPTDPLTLLAELAAEVSELPRDASTIRSWPTGSRTATAARSASSASASPNAKRSFERSRIARPKTVGSAQPVPMTADLVSELTAHRLPVGLDLRRIQPEALLFPHDRRNALRAVLRGR